MAMTANPESSFERFGKREFPQPKNAFLDFGRELAARGEEVRKTNIAILIFWRVFGFLIGFFLPMVGMGLYVLWRHDRPKDAKYPALGTSITLFIVVSYCLFIIIEYVLFPTPFIQRFPIQIFPESTRDFVIPYPLP